MTLFCIDLLVNLGEKKIYLSSIFRLKFSLRTDSKCNPYIPNYVLILVNLKDEHSLEQDLTLYVFSKLPTKLKQNISFEIPGIWLI